jgi:ubiquinone/menaquinone biosynthesis C-methylase UbiE
MPAFRSTYQALPEAQRGWELMSGIGERLSFELMSYCFAIRDLLRPPSEKLRRGPVEEGSQVLDYGCGPGGYSVAAARMAGDRGMVYAADVNPCAPVAVQRRARKAGLSNIETILTDCRTGLADESIDVALLFDTYHDLKNPAAVMKELHRVLKPSGILLFSDHHMKDDQIVTEMERTGLFEQAAKGSGIYRFSRK